jgi:urea transport system substrate-binding protein
LRRRAGPVLLVAFAAIGVLGLGLLRLQAQPPIRVGVLHSLSGTMAISEQDVADATLLAIDEINAAGGLLGGRKIEPVVVDGKSDWPLFAREAERLIAVEHVDAVFGCWTSACRKTVLPVFERQRSLLFYPVQYEGLEQSPDIVYLGAAPNQQILPAVKWASEKLGTRFYLVGSDYVFPRTANEIIKDQVEAIGGEVVGEDYLPLGSTEVAAIVERIRTAKPAVILNTINGDSNVAFFRALRAGGIRAADVPTISFSLGEAEIRRMAVSDLVGDYAAWCYFQSIDTPENRAFVEHFRARYGAGRVTDDPMEAAYAGVHLWAQAVAAAGTAEPQAVRDRLGVQSYPAPEGVVAIDADTQHLWKAVRIGRVRPDGQFDIVWDSGRPVKPEPYPGRRSRTEWQAFLDGLYEGWNGNWAKPASPP